MTIDNALGHFQADERDRAEARLRTLFDASDELLDEDELAFAEEWLEADADESEAPTRSEVKDLSSRYPEAISLLEKAESLKKSVEGPDAKDIESLSENLRNAIAADDSAAVASLVTELDDILFYVR